MDIITVAPITIVINPVRIWIARSSAADRFCNCEMLALVINEGVGHKHQDNGNAIAAIKIENNDRRITMELRESPVIGSTSSSLIVQSWLDN